MGLTVKFNNSAIRRIKKNMNDALIDTADDVLEKTIEKIPVKTGKLRDNTYVDSTAAERGRLSIVSDTDYAKTVYYNPEAAGNHWFSGTEDLAISSFRKNLERRIQ